MYTPVSHPFQQQYVYQHTSDFLDSSSTLFFAKTFIPNRSHIILLQSPNVLILLQQGKFFLHAHFLSFFFIRVIFYVILNVV